MTAADTVASVAVLAIAGLALVAALIGGRRELLRGGPPRAHDADPDAIARWHRGIAALKRVTRTRSTPPGHGRGGSDVSPTESPMSDRPSLR